MNRRQLLKATIYGAAAGLAIDSSVNAAGQRAAVLDAHIHLFDPTRPGGIPWPPKSDSVLYKPALPDRYQAVTAGMGVVGAIAIEASPLATDNDWLLDLARANPIMVGIVGDLIPDDAAFPRQLARLHRDPLFLGIRYGNLWKRDLAEDVTRTGFLDGLRLLAQAGLVFESANPDTTLLRALLKITEITPELRIVIDHLPHATVPDDAVAASQYWSLVKALSDHPQVLIKLSEIPVRVDGKLLTDPTFYQDRLDRLWDRFGEDRCLFGSDWPNSDTVASYDETLRIVHGYINTKGPRASHKFFWKNSITAYKWKPRLISQSHLA